MTAHTASHDACSDPSDSRTSWCNLEHINPLEIKDIVCSKNDRERTGQKEEDRTDGDQTTPHVARPVIGRPVIVHHEQQ